LSNAVAIDDDSSHKEDETHATNEEKEKSTKQVEPAFQFSKYAAM
jgi:hypothetical protein